MTAVRVNTASEKTETVEITDSTLANLYGKAARRMYRDKKTLGPIPEVTDYPTVVEFIVRGHCTLCVVEQATQDTGSGVVRQYRGVGLAQKSPKDLPDHLIGLSLAYYRACQDILVRMWGVGKTLRRSSVAKAA